MTITVKKKIYHYVDVDDRNCDYYMSDIQDILCRRDQKINVFLTLSQHIYSRKLSSKLTYNFSNYQVAIT